jgi:hypothetical protein
LFVPLLQASELAEVAAANAQIRTCLDRAGATSTFWASVSRTARADSNGELFFELLEGASYELLPV